MYKTYNLNDEETLKYVLEKSQIKYKKEDFFKEIINKNGNTVIVPDFFKIADSCFPYIIFLSERGAGKTYNVKEYSDFIHYELMKINPYYKLNPATKFMRCLDNQLEIEKKRYCGDAPIQYQSYEWTGDKDSGYFLLDQEKNIHTQLVALNTADKKSKGTRNVSMLTIFDEFNVGMNNVDDPAFQFDNFLNSNYNRVEMENSYNKQQYIIFANNKSLDNPILYDYLGINSITEDITQLYFDDGLPRALIIKVSFDNEQKELITDKNKYNFIFKQGMLNGYSNHSYFNESAFDEVNYCQQIMTNFKKFKPIDETEFDLFETLKVDNKFVNIYTFKKATHNILKTKHHIVAVDSLLQYFKKHDPNISEKDFISKRIRTSKMKWVDEETLIMDNAAVTSYRLAFQHRWLSFEDIKSRNLFQKLFTKY